MVEIFPNSPIWADLSRIPDWAKEQTLYDSGAYQGSTARSRPLYKYTVNAKNYNEISQASLENFWHEISGGVDPFFVKDPYRYLANSVVQPTSTNMGVGSGFYFVDVHSWQFIPDSAALYIEDPRSGELLDATDFVMSQDNGWCSLLVPVSSLWVSSFEYFIKGVFTNVMDERSNIWNNFATTLMIQEINPH